MAEKISGLLFHATDTPPWLFRHVKVTTSSESYPEYFPQPTFLECSGTQFLYLPLTQSVRLHLATYHSLCSTRVTNRMLCHAIGHQVLLTQPLPREAEDFCMGEQHFKCVPLLTCLIWVLHCRFCLRARAGLPRNIKLHETLSLQNIIFTKFYIQRTLYPLFTGFEPSLQQHIIIRVACFKHQTIDLYILL